MAFKWKQTVLVAGASAALAVAGTTLLPAAGKGELSTRQMAQRALDIQDVQNLASAYSHYYFQKNFDEVANLFALKTPGVSYKVPTGPVGGDAIRANLAQRKADLLAGKVPGGQFNFHPNESPYIIIAGDGKTAKGVWDMFGIDADSADSRWLYLHKACDFIKEDGVWKIWHMQDYPVFVTPFGKSPSQSAAEGFYKGRAAEKAGFWVYDGKSLPPMTTPKLPKPYQTFDPKDSY